MKINANANKTNVLSKFTAKIIIVLFIALSFAFIEYASNENHKIGFGAFKKYGNMVDSNLKGNSAEVFYMINNYRKYYHLLPLIDNRYIKLQEESKAGEKLLNEKDSKTDNNTDNIVDSITGNEADNKVGNVVGYETGDETACKTSAESSFKKDGQKVQSPSKDEKGNQAQDKLSIDLKPVYNGNKSKNQVAITFDDGPDEHFTLRVLDILKGNNIKATFFVIGVNVKKYPKVLKRIREEGHDIGNHSWGHKNFAKLSEDKIKDEVLDTEELISSILEEHQPILRVPFGSSGDKADEVVNSLGYYNIRWSVDTQDWSGISSSEIMSRVKKQLYPGGIILMHCSGKKEAMENSIKALPEVIKYIKDKGYEFVTISQMLEI
ncbi:MAG TPA: polysaccharide deacetylase family protein [Clostridiales bacterium]|nr:polysaccharide deacetylase family protein [Clostridiales bacterium]